MSVEGSPWWRGPSTSLAEGSGSMWLVGGGGISGFGVCRARRGRPRFLFMGGVETGMMEAVVCVLLELQRLDCLEMLVEVVSVVLRAPNDSTSEESRDLSLLVLTDVM